MKKTGFVIILILIVAGLIFGAGLLRESGQRNNSVSGKTVPGIRNDSVVQKSKTSNKTQVVTSNQPMVSAGTSFELEKAGENMGDMAALVEEFDLPDDIRFELLSAASDGQDATLDREAPSGEELNAQGLSENQIRKVPLSARRQTIASGYQLNSEEFNQVYQACQPTPNDDDYTKHLKIEVLFNAGFTALASGESGKAEKIFRSVIKNYTDTDVAQIASFELAGLKAREGNTGEALQIIDNIMPDIVTDENFKMQATELKESILNGLAK